MPLIALPLPGSLGMLHLWTSESAVEPQPTSACKGMKDPKWDLLRPSSFWIPDPWNWQNKMVVLIYWFGIICYAVTRTIPPPKLFLRLCRIKVTIKTYITYIFCSGIHTAQVQREEDNNGMWPKASWTESCNVLKCLIFLSITLTSSLFPQTTNISIEYYIL